MTTHETPVPVTPAPTTTPASPAFGAGPRFTVFPLRFTPNPQAYIDFLVTLGMARSVTAGDDNFGDLRAGAGAVMVHSSHNTASGAAAGTTDLCLAVTDADAAARHLESVGIDVTVWDESYGKQGRIQGPAEEGISLNEDQTDTYGYRGHDPADADPRVAVTAVLSSDDFARDAAYFARLGFETAGEPNRWWQELHGPGSTGIIGLHAPGGADARTRDGGAEFGPSMQVRLGFETGEDLDAVTERLQRAGYDAHRVDEHGISAVHVADPDGQHLEIHALP